MIRKARNKDIKKIVKLFIEGFSDHPYNEKWTEKNAKKKILEYYKNTHILVISDKDIILGFIIFHQIIWDRHLKIFIDEMVVKKEFRNKGIGKSLLKEVENYGRKKGINYLELATNIKSSAFEFYKNLGYKENDMILMEKRT